jgi:ketosteroid isomerase-like protein
MSVLPHRGEHADRVRAAFASWGVNNEPFFDIVADDVTWRIIGTTPVSGTHRSKQAFVEATTPLAARFSQPSRVIIKSVHEAGDTVFLQWEGVNDSISGRPYHQTYCWVLRMADGKAVEVIAYLDTALINDMFND